MDRDPRPDDPDTDGDLARDRAHDSDDLARDRAHDSDDLAENGDPAIDSDAAPETTYVLLQRGHALLDRRHHAQAAIVLERADRLEPGKGSILEALGRAYFNSGQHEPARGAFERLLELDPSAHYAHYALGQSLKRLGRRDEAGTHLRLAVALSPASVLYRDALARFGSGTLRAKPSLEPDGPEGGPTDPPPTDPPPTD